MKLLILGGSGMLGHKLVQVLSQEFDVLATIRSDFQKFESLGFLKKENTFENQSAENFADIAKNINDLKPDVIINAIGVIKQLKESKDVVKTLEINSVFPHKIAEIAKSVDARFITLSTDCVFDGAKGNYTESDLPNAIDLYGKSKHLGEVIEKNCLTIRTSIIGRELSSRNSLVEWFLNTEENPVKGFSNAIYTGFPTIVLAEIIKDIINNHKNLEGLYHVSSNPINKFQLLKLIKEEIKLNKEITKFSDFYIDRSLNSDRFRNETGFEPMSWEKMINRMFADATPYNKWRKIIS